MGDKKKKKKCCGKFAKKKTHCSSCPLSDTNETCKPDKGYCKDCDVPKKKKKKKKKKDKKDTKKKK